jgi:acyl-CoA synthetase (AMP-forming)/AMP-acid ligase II
LPAISLLTRLPAGDVPLHDDVAFLLYTSGSTGRPKGVMLTHANVDFLLQAGLAQDWLLPDDRVLAVLPMSHSFGLTSVALSALAAGACLLPRGNFEASAVSEAIAGREATAFLGVPAMYARLAEHARAADRSLRPNALRLAYVGGAPVEAALKRQYEDLLGVTLSSGYGLTEAAPTVTRTLASEARTDLSAGRPIPGIELRIVDPETRTDLPQGAVGVAIVRGPNVMRGYYKDPAATAAAIDEQGWLDTGDLARLDHDGRLFIVGRRKELIIRSGVNVYPQVVEQAIASHAGVAAVAVLRLARAGNEDVVAFLVPRDGAALDAGELRRHLAPLLAAYKIPSEFILRENLPLLVTGKIDKPALRRLLDSGS